MRNLITLFVAITLLCITTPATAEIPHYINFQGKATDSEGVPLDTPHDIKFRIYDIAEGEDPPIWDQEHTSVSMDKGVFSVLLEVDPAVASFDKPYWISIEVGTTNGSNELPRQRISSVGYAYKAKDTDHATIADSVTEVVVETRTDDPPNPKPGQIWLRTDIE